MTTGTPKTTKAGAVAHPAKFSDPILELFAERIGEYLPTLPRWGSAEEDIVALDPFAGVGKVHLLAEQYGLPLFTLAYELEPEWGSQHPRTRQGNALHLTDLADDSVDIVFTSPTYGNRLADHHVPKDESVRHSYAFYLGRMPSKGSSCTLPWGKAYRDFHELWMREMLRVLGGDCLLVINMKNHMRDFAEQRVVEFFINAACLRGCTVERVDPIGTPHLGHGANAEARCVEKLIWLRTPPSNPQGSLL